MITVSWWQLLLSILVLMGSVYYIVESRIKKNQDTISLYISTREQKTKKVLNMMIEDVFSRLEEMESLSKEIQKWKNL